MLIYTLEFKTVYKPKIGEIIFLGDLIQIKQEKEIKVIMKKWKKDKKVDNKNMAPILNTALTKCNVEAVMLARDLGLPSPVPMPKVQVKK
ncbi:hypothetical protein ACFL1H_06720 [Nanoarchaeota archaeon]